MVTDMQDIKTFLQRDRFAEYADAELVEVTPGYARARLSV
jgi:hypothetical protein